MLAEAVAGSHAVFVEQMNATAARLGMTRTKFANANGLPAPEQVTTARDLGSSLWRSCTTIPNMRDYGQCRRRGSGGASSVRIMAYSSTMPAPTA